MDTPTVEVMNEVIGTFMGYNMYDKRYPRNHGIGAPEREPEKCMIIQKAKYHSSWDWLMPVGKRIYDILAELLKKRPPHTACQGDVIEVDIMCAIHEYDIKKAHAAIYNFIQWHNLQKSAEDLLNPPEDKQPQGMPLPATDPFTNKQKDNE